MGESLAWGEETALTKLCVTKGTNVVGILGAGVGGLYTAIMLQSLDIDFEIIEGSDRVGGRIFTHKFEKGDEYDYYDIGAMRFPLPERKKGKYESGIMRRLGELFIYLDMEDKLIPYYFNSVKSPGFQYFNGVRARIPRKDEVPPDFNARSLGINDRLIGIGASRIVQDVVGPFAHLLYNDWKNDTTSALCTSTGRYDVALSESVLGAIAMGEVGDGVVDWKCIEVPSPAKDNGGFSSEESGIINAMVTAIGLESNDPESPMVVTAGGEKRTYSHVISTIPLPVLRTIDLKESHLDILQSNAVRQLQYVSSVKIAILFSENSWTTGKDKDGVSFNIVGGQSFTDLPIQTIVYPSQGAHSDKPSKTLIASYCWNNDVGRMGSLIGTGQKQYEDQLERLVLNNLAEVHNVTYDYLKSRLVEIHSWDWNHYPLSMGAAAFFGPGNLEDMYTSLSRPAARGKLHFAGEALSVRHGWVEGALDSAWRAVHNYLFFTDTSKIEKFFELWGRNGEWFEDSRKVGEALGLDEEALSSLLGRYLSLAHVQSTA